MAANQITYTPPPTVKQFIRDFRPGELFYDWIVGPVGSGKTTGQFFKLVFMAKLQAPGPDGIRRSRAVIVRNTGTQLRDTTLASWFAWFKDGQAGEWKATDKNFILRFGDVECEVLFRPLDTADDIARVLSLEVTFAIIDEFVQIPRAIIDALSARCGRYPSAKDGGATNWGMWGSSNPDTEDNWWYDYLTNNPGVERVGLANDAYVSSVRAGVGVDANAKYFLQPSGLSDAAENIENLPGKSKYYENQAKNKSDAWIKQYLEAEWGYSVSGKPVVPTFLADSHISKKPLFVNPKLELVIGLDPGISGSALIFGQQDLNGCLTVLGELVQAGYGAERLVKERLMPYLMQRGWSDLDIVLAPDPASANRGQNNETRVVEILKRHFPVKIESNNHLDKRLDAIEHFTTRLTINGPALQIDPDHCPILIRALKGGWRYALVPKTEDQPKPKPEKNKYSHPGDGFGYLCRYFHRGADREAKAKLNAQRFPRRRQPVNAYHFR